MDRLFGLETEYALTALDGYGRPVDRLDVLRRMLDLARERFPTLPDHTRQGVFLPNGPRFYIDAPDHPELATPEVQNPWDAAPATASSASSPPPPGPRRPESRRYRNGERNAYVAGVDDKVFESELFSHIKGSFTDADANKTGLWEAAADGTLFLDQIGDLSFDLQSKILRALDRNEILRVGSVEPIEVPNGDSTMKNMKG